MFALSEVWGNGEVSGSAPLGTRVLSPYAQVVFNTNSAWFVLRYAMLVAAGTAVRMDFLYSVTATSATRPGAWTPIAVNTAQGVHQTRQIALGGSGMQRVWITAGAKIDNTQACIESVFVASGSAAARVAPSGDGAVALGNSILNGSLSSTQALGCIPLLRLARNAWIGVDGGGSWNLKTSFGYYVIAGVLQGGAYATVRAALLARLVQMNVTGGGLTAIQFVSIGTNDALGATMNTSDYTIAVTALLNDLAAAFPNAAQSYITILRNTVDLSTYRAADVAACAAATRPPIVLDGYTLGAQAFGAGDLNVDGTHPNDAGQVKLAAGMGGLLS